MRYSTLILITTIKWGVRDIVPILLRYINNANQFCENLCFNTVEYDHIFQNISKILQNCKFM